MTTTIYDYDKYFAAKGYKRYTSIDDIYSAYRRVLEMPETDPLNEYDNENEYYDPENETQQIFEVARQLDNKRLSCKEQPSVIIIGNDSIPATKVGDLYYYVDDLCYYNEKVVEMLFDKNATDEYDDYFNELA